MKRRNVIIAGGGIALAAASSAGGLLLLHNQEEDEEGIDPDKLPEEANYELLSSFYDAVEGEFQKLRVGFTKDWTIGMQYTSTAGHGDSLETELYHIASIFGNECKEHGAESLTVLANGVQMIVPEEGAKAYANGNLKEDAFLETVNITTGSGGNDED